ncbi:MAG: sugar ABC transporter permease [Clostridiaceae bacterium]|nr:sugar ABC transporter permease [Clostridiaceae bacterium]
MEKIKQVIRKNTMLLILIIVTLIFQFLITRSGSSSLFTPANITNLISQNAYVVILSTGMLLCILTGGNVDLSTGSMVALVGALAGTLIVRQGLNIHLSIFLCLIVGILLGAWQGFWIAYVNVPAFIATLAGMLTFRGFAWIILDGLTISPFPQSYLKYFNSFIPSNPEIRFVFTLTVGILLSVTIFVVSLVFRLRKKSIGYKIISFSSFIVRKILISLVIIGASILLGKDKGIPAILIILSIIVFVYHYFTSRTVYGRHLYAVGGNYQAAALSGVNTKGITFLAYTNMGFLSAITALVSVARFNSAAPSAGSSYEMDAIAACYIGGASAYGGIGTVRGAVIGGVFMGILNNGMSILGIDANWQMAVKGFVLLAAVIFDVVSKNRVQVES